MRLKQRSGFLETRKARIIAIHRNAGVLGTNVLEADAADDGGVVTNILGVETLYWFSVSWFHGLAPCT
jgi:hypothetical protein